MDVRIETGWSLCAPSRDRPEFEQDIALALERGARERERYEFFAAVGHELRTPLTSIRGYLETLLDEPVDAPTSRRFLETARREALRMGRLLEGMFEFSLLDLSAGPSALECSSVRERIAQACESVAPLAALR
ncbi:MAG: histidine kinase dimerization/phospho-acceptor domain-containing protein, partial [Candidatus Baltobacteraceae bacterium]